MFRNVFTLLAGTTLLILGFMFSVLAIAVIAALGLAIWGYLWFKTRKIRRTMQEQAPEGQIIDGEAVVVEDTSAETRSASPDGLPTQRLPSLSSKQAT